MRLVFDADLEAAISDHLSSRLLPKYHLRHAEHRRPSQLTYFDVCIH